MKLKAVADCFLAKKKEETEGTAQDQELQGFIYIDVSVLVLSWAVGLHRFPDHGLGQIPYLCVYPAKGQCGKGATRYR